MSQNGNGSKPDFVTINIDGQDYQAPNGVNLIDALHGLGKEIPHYCYHPKLSVVGNCRMCMVEMGMPMRDRATGEPVLDDNGVQKIGWMPKPAIACSSKVMPGLHLRLESELTRNCREGVMEFLLVNHPLDCPICDQAGECSLQEFATDYGRGFSRFVDEKNSKPKRVRVGPRVMLDNERCILCSRCIRFCDEIDKDPVLGFVERGSHSMIATAPGRQLDSNYSLNTVDICPVGALTSTDFRFKMRVWFLKRTRSICTESSTGVNTEVWSREGVVYRITPRRNDAVNDTWMPDSGRELYKQIEADNRKADYRVDNNRTTIHTALDRARELACLGKVAFVANGRASVEEQYVIGQFAKALGAEIHLVAHHREGDGRLISEDATPNLRGALLTGLTDTLPADNLETLAARIEAGEVKTVIALNEDVKASGLKAEHLKTANLIDIGTHTHSASGHARVSLPSLTVFEKTGSFVNRQFRLQTFQQAVPGPAGVLPDTHLLARLQAEITGQPVEPLSLTAIWERLSMSVPQFAGLRFADIPEEGQPLEMAVFADLPFCEQPGWHFEPAAEAAALLG